MRKFANILFLNFFLIISSLFISITHASAHAELVSSTPATDEILTSAPDRVTLTFGEKLLVISGKATNTVEVKNSQGDTFSIEPANISGPEITTNIATERMIDGKYTVTYRVVSADGHPLNGHYEFSISQSSNSTPSTTAESTSANATDQGFFERNATPIGFILIILALLIGLIIYRNRKP